MIGDHINKYLLNTIPILYNAGRVVMPLFCFVLAYCYRPDSYTYSVYSKVCQRLMIWPSGDTCIHNAGWCNWLVAA